MARLMTANGRIESTQEVLDAILGTESRKLTKRKVSQIMRSDLGLRFKKARVVNERANLLSSRV